MKILVIGGTGHVGGPVTAALQDRHEVLVASRTSDLSVDISDPRSIEEMFSRTGQLDAVVICVGKAPFKPLAELTREDFTAGFTHKVLGQVEIVQQGTPALRDGGSFTLTTGILAREPIRTGAASSLANGALEAFVMAAAVELPRGIRINAVSATVLAEAPSYHESFRGFTQAPAATVAQAYVKSVEGVQTGCVFKIG